MRQSEKKSFRVVDHLQYANDFILSSSQQPFCICICDYFALACLLFKAKQQQNHRNMELTQYEERKRAKYTPPL